MMEEMGTPPLSAMEGVRELMNVAERGDCLTAAQLEQAESALTAVKRLKDYLKRCKALELSLPWYEQNLDELDETRESIHVKIRNGAVDDYASKLLHELRSGIVRLEEKMKEKAEAVIRSNKECMSDSYSVNRNGHLCVPVKKEYKFRVSGSVIDKSATGNTLFIEPTAVAKYSEELQLMRIDEENEERRILYTLSAMLGGQGETMEQNMRTMEKLDFCFSKGKLSMELGCAAPDINTERRLRLTAARHPLMDRTVCVPQDFYIGDLDISPFPLPHDAADPCGYAFTCGRLRAAIATDIGCLREGWLKAVSGCELVLLESNYDPGMLKAGRYPYALKTRILGTKGHLSNEDAGRAACRLVESGVRSLILGHLSRENNFPELALETVRLALTEAGVKVGTDAELTVASRDHASGMFAVRDGFDLIRRA